LSSPSPEFIRLVEEETREFNATELPVDVVVSLYEVLKDRVEIEFPSPITRKYRITPRGIVGQIPIGDDYIVTILPKAPIANVFRMLEYAYNLRSFRLLDGAAYSDSLEGVVERLIFILAQGILRRIKRGLYRDYSSRQETISQVRGRIQIIPTLKNRQNGLAHQVVCEYDEHSADLDDNTILAWTLFKLLSFPIVREEVRHAVKSAFKLMSSEVTLREVTARDCINRRYHRLNDDYKMLHSLCRFVLENSGPAIQSGDRQMIPFLVHMPSLFEAYVYEWLRQNLPPTWQLKSQYKLQLDRDYQFKIDLVLLDIASGRTLAVLDTKYKTATRASSDDVAQIIAYATTMSSTHAILVYPTTLSRPVNIVSGNVTVTSMLFDIGLEPDVAGTQFTAELRTLLNA
jgi:5-methylcytosine-specific restriction enzyme subunit McrC